MTTALTFRLSTPADREAMFDLYNGASTWLHDVKGITDQWDREISAGEINRLIESGDFYLGWLNGMVVAGIRLTEKADFLWIGRPARALYLHSLAVRRDLAGQRIGSQVLGWAADQARQQGYTRLRLDCMAANPRLRQYYRDHGFTDLGQHSVHAWYALFEKEI